MHGVGSGGAGRRRRPAASGGGERTLNLWRDVASAPTNRQPWEPDLTLDEIRTYHAIREPGDPPRIFD